MKKLNTVATRYGCQSCQGLSSDRVHYRAQRAKGKGKGEEKGEGEKGRGGEIYYFLFAIFDLLFPVGASGPNEDNDSQVTQ